MQPNETLILRRLRSPDLAHSLRGYDETETGQLLEQAATALEAAYQERDRMREEALRAGPKAEAVPADLEAIGRALLTASATGEQIVADAQERAEHLVGRATANAEAIRAEAVEAGQQTVASARAEADRLIAEARAEVERLRGQAEEIAALMESKRTGFVEFAGAALDELERMERRTGGGGSDLQPLEALAKPVPPVR